MAKVGIIIIAIIATYKEAATAESSNSPSSS
jgi:hypothetical protein